jgi:sugar lactone lactonase YvrE
VTGEKGSAARSAEQRSMQLSRFIASSIVLLVAAGCSPPASPQQPALPGLLHAAPAGSGVGADVRELLYAGGPVQNTVGVYRASGNNRKPLRTIANGLNAPTGIAVDSSGNVYVCNNAGMRTGPRGAKKGTWTVTVYKRGQTVPFESYSDAVWSPVDVAIAPDGTVFIANFSSSVTIYPAGSLTHSRTLVGPSGQAPLGLALDAAGNLFVSYVSNLSGGGSIYEYAPGQNTGTNIGINFSGEPHGLAIDGRGNLIVAVSKAPGSGSDIEIFAPGSTTPKKKISGPFQPFMLALGSNGRRLFAADFGSGNGDGAVFKYAYPSGKLIAKDTQGPAAYGYGVAIDL